MKIDGACLCGHVSYEAEINPDKVMICHCTDCQINSATAFRYGAPVDKQNFQLKSGTLKFYVKTADSGSKRALGFCPECGTSIYGCDPVDAKVFSLRLGTARQRSEFFPRLQIWRRSALTWVDDISRMDSHDGQPWRRKG